MNAARLTLALLILAAAVYLGVTRPAAQALMAATEEHRQARDARATRESRLARIERREREQARALALLAGACSHSLPAVRRHVIERLSGLPLSDLHLEITAAPAPAFAEVKVGVRGDFSNVVALSSQLARPDAGLALKNVAFARDERDERVKLALTANTVGGRP